MSLTVALISFLCVSNVLLVLVIFSLARTLGQKAILMKIENPDLVGYLDFSKVPVRKKAKPRRKK